MSLCRCALSPSLAEVAVADDFQERFVRDAHTLVAEGYTRLDPRTLTAQSEEVISELIVEQVHMWFAEPTSPRWTTTYFVKPEVPERRTKRQGKKRPRIDIYVESSEASSRPCFAFEAKRLYRSDSVSEYVGPAGLGAFVDSTYVPAAPAAAMLGFVQRGPNSDPIEKIRAKLDAARDDHGLAEDGDVWGPVSLDVRLGTTWRSRHRRTAPSPPVDIYHSFLRCCA